MTNHDLTTPAEVLEAACVVLCWRCRDGLPVTLSTGSIYESWYHDGKPCFAADIRALAARIPPEPAAGECSTLPSLFRTFLFSYRHDGAEWSFELKAKDERDALARIARLQNASYDGELRYKLPVQAGLIARFYVGIRNLLSLAQRP